MCLVLEIKAQYISVHPVGMAKYYSTTVSPIINQGKKWLNNPQYIGLKYDHWLLDKKLLLSGFFYRFDGNTGFEVTEPFFGYGSTRTVIYRYGSLIGWNLLTGNSSFTITPTAAIIFQNAVGTAPSGPNGPIDQDYLPFEGTRYTEVLPGAQIVIGPGIDLGWNPFWRILLNFKFYYAFAFKPYQRYIVEYSYNGIPQPDGVWESRGTGMFLSVGLGFRLFDIQMKPSPKGRAKLK